MVGFFHYPEEDFLNKGENETREYKLTADANGNIIVPDEVSKMLGIKEASEALFQPVWVVCGDKVSFNAHNIAPKNIYKPKLLQIINL